MGVAETLEVLAHKYILAIVSTNKHENIIKLGRAGGIDPKMFRIIIGDDEVKRPKPAPDGILEVKKLTSAPIDYFVGDTIYDLRAAKAADVRAVGVLSGIGTFNQLWAEKPAHVISSVVELPNVL
jgi:HAD superfamily hydrolase (TIGR01549 family)